MESGGESWGQTSTVEHYGKQRHKTQHREQFCGAKEPFQKQTKKSPVDLGS